SAWGPSGVRLLGRFCHADERLRRLVSEHLREEERALGPEVVAAEIVHLPDGRTGNVLCRPTLRDHEIPFLGRSGAPTDRQIPSSDLMVSVGGGRVVLRSARLGVRVVPRLSVAHNFAGHGVSVYRFLCRLQEDGVAGALVWDWGPFESRPFLPRVTY